MSCFAFFTNGSPTIPALSEDRFFDDGRMSEERDMFIRERTTGADERLRAKPSLSSRWCEEAQETSDEMGGMTDSGPGRPRITARVIDPNLSHDAEGKVGYNLRAIKPVGNRHGGNWHSWNACGRQS